LIQAKFNKAIILYLLLQLIYKIKLVSFTLITIMVFLSNYLKRKRHILQRETNTFNLTLIDFIKEWTLLSKKALKVYVLPMNSGFCSRLCRNS